MKEYETVLHLQINGIDWEIPLVFFYIHSSADPAHGVAEEVDVVGMQTKVEYLSDLLFPDKAIEALEGDILEHMRRSKNTYTKEGRE